MNANDRGLSRRVPGRDRCRGAAGAARGLRMGMVVIAIAASCTGRVHAEAPAVVPPESVPAPGWPDSDIVDELLRRETRDALAAQERHRKMQEQRRHARGGPPHRPDAGAVGDTQPDRIDLAAIYGVGKRLDVELLVNGMRLRYRHGKKWPDEAPDGDGAYALRAIHGHCVMLDGTDGHRRVCLAGGG